MKLRTALSLILAGVLGSALALAQTVPGPDKADSLSFIKTAADIAGNVQQQSLDTFLAIYVSEQNWGSGVKDGDLGPFLKIKEAKPGRSAAFFFNEAKDAAICVYFDGKSPFGVVAVKSASGAAIQPSEISAAYKDVSKDMLKKGDQEWHFTQNGVTADDGTSLPAFQITK